MDNFTPIPALIGGVMIGLAALWMLALHGKIAGISGILHSFVVARGPAEFAWRAWFFAGLIGAGFLWHLYAGPAPARPEFGLGWAAAAGFLAGLGTRMSGGCTSGHGVCGLGRFSLRSLVAVCVFMGVAGIATYVVRHVLGVPA